LKNETPLPDRTRGGVLGGGGRGLKVRFTPFDVG
jgi:hypothetical protein